MSIPYITQPDVVHYACTCGLLKPIVRLYFCRHCLQIRCSYCVCQEVDSYYCGKCAENIPSSEARLKKNRCSNCYDCPNCHFRLSARVSSAGPSDPDDPKSPIKKVYYLACLFCRWSTRDVGIPDQSAAYGGWSERPNVYANRLAAVFEKYKGIASAEVRHAKLDKDKRKPLFRSKYTTLTDKTGLTVSIIRERVGLPPLKTTTPTDAAAPAVAKEDVEGLSADTFTKSLDLSQTNTLKQMLLQPSAQPVSVDRLYPVHKLLLVKCSYRCRSCEHNVVKPEYNPSAIKFKIQLFAYYHIPEIRIMTVELLRAGQVCDLIMKLYNPTQHQTTISFLPLPEEEAPPEVKTEQESDEEKTKTSISASLTPSPSVIVKPRPVNVKLTGELIVPDSGFVLPPRDDAAEYDDPGEGHGFQDDSKFVVWRKSNKAAVKLSVKPHENLNVGDEVKIGFIMQHVYVNTIATAENKEPQKYNHQVKVYLTLGKVVGPA